MFVARKFLCHEGQIINYIYSPNPIKKTIKEPDCSATQYGLRDCRICGYLSAEKESVCRTLSEHRLTYLTFVVKLWTFLHRTFINYIFFLFIL